MKGLYQQVLGRTGSTSDWDAWTQALDSGKLTTTVVALEFLRSHEYDQDLVNGGVFNYGPMWQGFYSHYLHRAAEPVGLAGWVPDLQAGMTDQFVLAGILGSPEGYGIWS